MVFYSFSGKTNHHLVRCDDGGGVFQCLVVSVVYMVYAGHSRANARVGVAAVGDGAASWRRGRRRVTGDV